MSEDNLKPGDSLPSLDEHTKQALDYLVQRFIELMNQSKRNEEKDQAEVDREVEIQRQSLQRKHDQLESEKQDEIDRRRREAEQKEQTKPKEPSIPAQLPSPPKMSEQSNRDFIGPGTMRAAALNKLKPKQ